MTKKAIPYLLLLTAVSLLMHSCALSNREIESKNWKLSDIRRGDSETPPLWHNIDYITFTESRYYFLARDTIYRDNAPYATIIHRQRVPSVAIEIVIIGSTDTIRYAAK